MLNKSLTNFFSLTPFEINSPEEYAITNPSVIRIESGYQILCRGMLEEKNLTTKNICYFFNGNLELLSSTVISDDDVRKKFLECQNGLEDGRLFTWKQKTWVIFSGLKNSDSGYVNTMMIGEIFHNRLINVKLLKSPHQMIREKNWMPWVLGDRLFFLYALAPLEIYELVEDSLVCVFKGKGLARRKSFISGSSQVVEWGDGYLAVTHTRHSISIFKKFWMKYLLRDKSYKFKKTYFLHQFVILNDKFEVTGFSKDFFFEEFGIEFCAGVAVSENGLIISYGVKDAQAKLINLSADKLSALIKNVD